MRLVIPLNAKNVVNVKTCPIFKQNTADVTIYHPSIPWEPGYFLD